MHWIKALVNITFLFTLSFVGCKTIKPIEEPKYEHSFIKIESTKSPVPTSTITGNAKSINDGQPISFATVSLNSKTKQMVVQTDENGNFTIKNLAIDSYSLTIRSADYESKDIYFGMEEHTNFAVEARLFIPECLTPTFRSFDPHVDKYVIKPGLR